MSMDDSINIDGTLERGSGARKERDASGFGKGGKPGRFARRKVCRFCADKNVGIDYKDPQTLKYFITDRGKIIPRRISGNCAKHQRKVSVAIKRARMIALMPFTVIGQ
jgi:small subunit ribosomal protein S18